MKAIIFAGGVGTRLWPLSRKNSPKQFEKVIGDKSTLQLAVDRLLSKFSWDDIYISTADKYIHIVQGQLPKLNPKNIIGEPERRDVGPAVGLAMANLLKKFPNIPTLILWSDHIIKNGEIFQKILDVSHNVLSKDKNKLIFISQKSRFASQNLGWIRFGSEHKEVSGIKLFDFESFHYRPDLAMAEKFSASKNYGWNLGYFVSTPSFVWKLFADYQPQMHKMLSKILDTVGTDKYQSTVNRIYPTLPKLSFDNAVLEKIKKRDAYVISENLGWSDIGAWEALKEALQTSQEQNVTSGKVLVNDCRDSLVYNYTNQMVVTIDLDGFLVINTHDVILVCHKNSVPKIKKLVESLAGSENKHLI